jgi:HSP20 family protein
MLQRTSKNVARELVDFNRIRNQYDELIDHVMRGFGLSSVPELNEVDFIPSLDVIDKKDQIEIRIEIPGMEQKDIQVNLDNNVLIISGIKTQEPKEEGDNISRSERCFGFFRRDMTLPDNIDLDKISAVTKNGILFVSVPKKEIVKNNSSRKVEVKSL